MRIFLQGPGHRSAGERLIKTPKPYFADSGLLAYMLAFRDWTTSTRA
jgi:hypothetical protein